MIWAMVEFQGAGLLCGSCLDLDHEPAHVAAVEAVPVRLAGRGELERRRSAVQARAAGLLGEGAAQHEADTGTVVAVPRQGTTGRVQALDQGNAVELRSAEAASGWGTG